MEAVDHPASSPVPGGGARTGWRWRAPADADAPGQAGLVRSLAAETGLEPAAVGVCVRRGLATADAIRDFLSPSLEDLTPPSRILDLDRAVERLAQARASGEAVRVYGDYDVDGTSGAALLTWVLRELKFPVFDVRQPDRFKDGYGLGAPAVDQAASDGVRVLVTVDCGITSFDAAARASELGIDLIVVDHHQIDAVRGLPPAHAIVNPQRADCASGLKQLCGCALAFYLGLGLRARGRADGWFALGEAPNMKAHLDLVVLATAADMVPLTGDNHILVRHGLEVLKTTRKPGLKALLESSGIGARENVSPSHLGFVLGPRINASGRIGSAATAWELLSTADAGRASKLAAELEAANLERQEIQNRIWDEVRARVEAGIARGEFRHAIVVGDPGWHEGVVGIVASRVVDTFRRPAAVLALREDFGKGSVRSANGIDVLGALRACAGLLRTFGGHRHAAGLSVELGSFEAFARAFDEAVGEQAALGPTEAPLLETDGELSFAEITPKLLRELERMGPYGPGHREPVFTLRAEVERYQILKGRHLKLTLRDESGERSLAGIWFGAGERFEALEPSLKRGEFSEWVGIPELNRFRGSVTPTLRVRDQRHLTGPDWPRTLESRRFL